MINNTLLANEHDGFGELIYFPTAAHTSRVSNAPTPQAAEPIKDIDMLKNIEEALLASGKFGYRNYMIFLMGLNSGRRCGDVLKLKLKDVVDDRGCVRDKFVHVEQKTGKRIEFYLNQHTTEALQAYVNSLPASQDYLFASHKGGKLQTRSFFHILQDIKEQLGIDTPFGTHVMRKSFGYHAYQQNKNKNIEGGFDVVDMLQEAYGHSSKSITMRYIGITEENKKDLYNSISL